MLRFCEAKMPIFWCKMGRCRRLPSPRLDSVPPVTEAGSAHQDNKLIDPRYYSLLLVSKLVSLISQY